MYIYTRIYMAEIVRVLIECATAHSCASWSNVTCVSESCHTFECVISNM